MYMVQNAVHEDIIFQNIVCNWKKNEDKNLQNAKNFFWYGRFWRVGRSTANQQYFKASLKI